MSGAAPHTPPARSPNTDLVREMVACYTSMNAEGLRPLLHPEAKHSAPGSDFGADIEGGSTIADYFRTQVFPAFHDVRFEIVNCYEDAAQSVVIVEWRSHLKPKSGNDYSNNGAFFVEIRDGAIYWVREYFDTEKAHQNV